MTVINRSGTLFTQEVHLLAYSLTYNGNITCSLVSKLPAAEVMQPGPYQ